MLSYVLSPPLAPHPLPTPLEAVWVYLPARRTGKSNQEREKASFSARCVHCHRVRTQNSLPVFDSPGAHADMLKIERKLITTLGRNCPHLTIKLLNPKYYPSGWRELAQLLILETASLIAP